MIPAGLRDAARGALMLAAKDLRAEARGRTVVQGVAFFAALAALLFSFALGPDAETLRRFAPGLLWLAVGLASLLSVARSFAAERELGTLEQLLCYPLPREALFLGKALANFLLMLAVAAAALALMAGLYTLPMPTAWPLATALVLGALGLAAAGTFYGAVSASLRAREALVPMLLLPILVPLLIAATELTDAAFTDAAAGDWAMLLLSFDVTILVLGTALFPHVIEE